MKNVLLIIAVCCIGMLSFSQKQNTPENLELLKGEWKLESNWGESQMVFSMIQETEKDKKDLSIKNTVEFNENGEIIKRTYGTFGCGTAYMMNLNLTHTKWKYSNGILHIKGNFRDYRGEQFLDEYYEIKSEGNQLILSKIN